MSLVIKVCEFSFEFLPVQRPPHFYESKNKKEKKRGEEKMSIFVYVDTI